MLCLSGLNYILVGCPCDRFELAAQRLCTCITTLLYISLPSWYDCEVKPPYFTFYGGHENEITIFFSFF